MSRDVLTVGSTMRILLLFRGEYSQWSERFMNYLKEQTDVEAMINSIKNGGQPLHTVTQVSIAGATSRLPNDTDSLIDCNKPAKDLWDALERHMLGSEYGEQDRKAAVLYKYETVKATEGELLLYTYIRYLQVINDLKKCGYSKDNYKLNFKFLNNLQPEWKRTSSTTSSANKKQEYVKYDDKKEEKKVDEKKRDTSKVKCYNCKKEGHFSKDCKKAKVKDYEYYKTKMLFAKKEKDEQVLLAEDHAWMEAYMIQVASKKVKLAFENADFEFESRVDTFRDKDVLQDKDCIRSTRSVVIQDTPSALNPKPSASNPKLKGVQYLTLEEQEAADVMQALKESKKTSKRQSTTEGSSEGTGRIPGVPNESTVVFATSSEGTEEDLNEEEELDWIDSEEDYEKKHDTDDEKSIDLEMTDDEVLQGKEQVNDDEDDEMLNAKVEDSGKGDAEISNVGKADAEKTEEAKDESKKAELPPTSSSLSISLGFGDQFLKLSSDTSLIGTVKDTIDAEISSLLDIKIQSEVLYIQSPCVLKVPVTMISEPSVLTPVQETPSTAHVTTLPTPFVSTIPPAPLQQTTALIPSPLIITDAPTITTVVPKSNALFVVQLRVEKIEKDVSELRKIDHSAKALATLKS
nr:hypothetical protein [Tanacetum cinerariifolium]